MTIDFRSDLDQSNGDHCIIVSPVNISFSKEFTAKLRCTKRNFAVYKYVLHFETMKPGIELCKGSLGHKITIFYTVQFNSFIDFEWFNNGLVDNSNHIIILPAPCCLL